MTGGSSTSRVGPALVAVLMYHAVGVPRERRFGKFVVPEALLEEQLLALGEAGYLLGPLTEGFGAAAAEPRRVLLTFDDGYADFAERAAPVLIRIGARATVYVVTGRVGHLATWLPFEAERRRPLMDWTDINALASAGFEIGSHSHSHAALDALAPQDVEGEVTRSRDLIADKTGRPPTSFCYPNGHHNPRIRAAVKAAGFSSAREVGHGLFPLGGDTMRVRRLMVGPHSSPEALAARVAGPERDLSSHARGLLRPLWRRALRVRERHDAKAWE